MALCGGSWQSAVVSAAARSRFRQNAVTTRALIGRVFSNPIARIDRYLRGRKSLRHIQGCDVAVVSFGKSGRTWLRVLLSRFYQQRYGLGEGSMLIYDNLHRADPRIPTVYFTHDYYLADYTGESVSKEPYRHCKVVLLVRDPRDTAVSSYFQRKHRMRAWKKFINGYPASGPGSSIFSFMMGASGGLPKVVRYMNDWARALETHERSIVVRYEDLRADTAGELARLLRFLGEDPTEAELAECVRFASIESMQRMEKEGGGALGRRLQAGDKDNPDSFKVRKASVGGYREHLTPEQIALAETFLREELAPSFGYGADSAASP